MQHNDSSTSSNFQLCMEFMRPGHMLRRSIMGPATAALGLSALASAALICAAASAAPRSTSPASCREAANGLISLLDDKKDDTALYRDTYAVVVDTCGPAATASRPAAPPSPPDRAKCRDLAAAMVDLIEDDKMDTPAFATARNAFASACAPR
jgi:hypothetical protein